MDNNTWPDPARPGVPLNPEQDSEGHVWTVDGVMEIYKWVASKQWYEDTRGHWFSPTCIEGDDYYHGRIVTPAEVDVRVQQARRDALEEAIQAAANSIHRREIIEAIRALKGEGDE
jgi:hypothetical protein